jgi:hypothetical protein
MLHGVYAFWRYRVTELSKDEYWFWGNIFCKSLQMYLRNCGHSHLWYTALIFRVNSTKCQLLLLNVIKSTWVVTHIFELTELFCSEDFLTFKFFMPPTPNTDTYIRCACMCRVESWFKVVKFLKDSPGFQIQNNGLYYKRYSSSTLIYEHKL